MGYAGLAEAYTELAGSIRPLAGSYAESQRAAETALRLDNRWPMLTRPGLRASRLRVGRPGCGEVAPPCALLSIRPWRRPGSITRPTVDPGTVRPRRSGRSGEPSTSIRGPIRPTRLGTTLLLFTASLRQGNRTRAKGPGIQRGPCFILAFQGVPLAELRRFGEAVENVEERRGWTIASRSGRCRRTCSPSPA